MVWPAQQLEVGWVISATVSLSSDVIDRYTRYHQTFTQALLAQPFVSGFYQWFQLIPVSTIATLMPGLTLLVVLPSGVLMFRTITCAVDRSVAAPMLTAGARYSGWHGVTPKEKPPAYKASDCGESMSCLASFIHERTKTDTFYPLLDFRE